MRVFKILFIVVSVVIISCRQSNYPDLKDGLYADIQTVKGNVLVQLEYEKAPITVANFVSLAEGTNTMVDSIYKGKKFYNGTIFHRVINDFMIQGGDPESRTASQNKVFSDGAPAETLTLFGSDDIRLRRSQIDEGNAPGDRKPKG